MGQCSSKPPATSGDAEVPRATVTAVVTQREPGVSEKVQEASLEESEGGDAADLPVSNSSYDEADIHATQASQKKAAVLSSSSDGDANGKASVDPSLPSNASGSSAEVQDVLKEYTLLAEMLQYSPYAVTLIDVEQSHQPFVFANQVFLQQMGFKESDVVGQSWQMYLQTPFQHTAHSDVPERIREAFETGCEFREVAACYTKGGDIVTFQLLFLPVSKDVGSGVTHYVCVHIASETTTKEMRAKDPSSPVALPKLPDGMAEVATARYVSITMKNATPEQLLGGSIESLGIRVGSFHGSPIAPKVKQAAGRSGLGKASAAAEEPTKPAPKAQPAQKVKSGKGKAKSRFAPAGEDADEDYESDLPISPVAAMGALGNLRHDSALMGAISSTKGKMAMPAVVPRTKEDLWLQRLRNQLTAPLEEALKNS